MKRKVGEIFEYNGEWYQCLEGDTCAECDLRNKICLRDTNIFPFKTCVSTFRTNGKSVIFKKLEKIGEPYNNNGKLVQNYKLYIPVYGINEDEINSIIPIEIKQNKEDMEEKKIDYLKLFSRLPHLTKDGEVKDDGAMSPTLYHWDGEWVVQWMDEDGATWIDTFCGNTIEEAITKANNYCVRNNYIKGSIILENTLYKDTVRHREDMEEKKLNLKPFSLELAKQGKPVCTRDGRKARIVCFDAKGDKPIIALIEAKGNHDALIEKVEKYFINGHSVFEVRETDDDLIMLPEKKEGWVNVYRGQVYNSLEIAERAVDYEDNFLKTIKIDWEE